MDWNGCQKTNNFFEATIFLKDMLMHCHNCYYYGNSPAIKLWHMCHLYCLDIGLQSWSTNFILYHLHATECHLLFKKTQYQKGCRILFLILSMLLFLCVFFANGCVIFYGSLSQSDILLLQIKIQNISLKNYDDEVWWTVRNEILTCF